MAKDRLQVLAVGDVVIDAFIDLIEKYEYVDKGPDGTPILNIPLGTKIPYDKAVIVPGVGNAANAAVSFARLGLRSGLISNVGSDDWGKDIIRALKGNNVDTRFVHENPGKISNYHYVLWYEEERTIFVKGEQYDYEWPHLRNQDIPEWIYFSSINEELPEYHDALANWLDENPSVKMAFQPGTFQMSLGLDRLRNIYQRADVVALNREEATDVFGANHDDIHDQLNKMHEAGIKIALVTDGPNGAYASDGNRRWSMPLYPDPAPPKDRTGAGDAFASTFTAALIAGADVPSALLWAPINSMNVVQKVGAQEGLLTHEQIDKFLREAPSDYHPSEM